jgi:hypothetical protein
MSKIRELEKKIGNLEIEKAKLTEDWNQLDHQYDILEKEHEQALARLAAVEEVNEKLLSKGDNNSETSDHEYTKSHNPNYSYHAHVGPSPQSSRPSNIRVSPTPRHNPSGNSGHRRFESSDSGYYN